jgi:hypothetical protein
MNLSSEEKTKLLKSLRDIHKSGGVLTTAGACSGTNSFDVAVEKVLLAINNWASRFHPTDSGVGAPPHRNLWACESNEQKRKFLSQNSQPEAIYTDIADLPNGVVFDAVTKQCNKLGVASMFEIGWPCVAVSMLNNNRRKNRRCIRNATGASGNVFGHFMKLLGSDLAALLSLGENASWPDSSSGVSFTAVS